MRYLWRNKVKNTSINNIYFGITSELFGSDEVQVIEGFFSALTYVFNFS